MFKSAHALVLRETKYKETDKILTLLSSGEGKLTASARGVMGKNSKLAAACQLLTFSEMTFYERQGHLYIKEAQSVEQFLGLREDISHLALGMYFAELLEAVSDEDSPSPEVLSLGLNSLFALSEKLYSPEHIKSVFELRLMCLAGFEPLLDYCSACGEEPQDAVFSTAGGTVLCKSCRSAGYGETLPLGGDALEAMRHIVSAEPKRVFAFSLGEAAAARLFEVCEAYVTAQLERRFQALDYWYKVR